MGASKRSTRDLFGHPKTQGKLASWFSLADAPDACAYWYVVYRNAQAQAQLEGGRFLDAKAQYQGEGDSDEMVVV